jgi:hypothetical protein
MVFNGIEGVQQLASDVGAKSFVIHEKGVKTRALRQRSVGTTTKVKSELGKFANVPEYQNGQYFIMMFDTESAPRTGRESQACATAEFSLGNITHAAPEPTYNANIVSGLNIGEIEKRAGQIAENAILKYQIEQKDREIRDLEKDLNEPTTDYTEMMLNALSGVLAQKGANSTPPPVKSEAVVNGVNGQIKGEPMKEAILTDNIEKSLKRLEHAVGGKKQLEVKLQELADKVEKNPLLLKLL